MAASTINVAVIGAGSWGTTVAALAAANTPTVLWARRSSLAEDINASRVNAEYLPTFTLPEELRATDSLADAVSHADVVVMAVPSHGYRDVAVEAAESIRPWVPVVSLSKGLERTSLKRMSEVTADAMPGHPVAVLTGPNLAKEILSGQPAASVVAIDDVTIAILTGFMVGSLRKVWPFKDKVASAAGEMIEKNALPSSLGAEFFIALALAALGCAVVVGISLIEKKKAS